ncbi:response regulator, partial [Pseudorhodobacter sp.]|uniref:response regulator n=1 Tax=Pseudorhodobacter sp. TaxID=1934400 RepID=UPI002648B145
QSNAKVDLLFTDVVMPGETTSRELAEKALDLRPGLSVLFTSGFVQDSIVHGGRLDAEVQLLVKPYTQATLAQKIRDLLGTAGAEKVSFPPDVVPSAAHSKIALDYPEKAAPVLICEDDVLIRMNIAEVLREHGYQVLEAGTAKKALDMMAAEPVSLLITDIGLPDQTGEELARLAREITPKLPVIFATGGVDVPSAATLGNCKILGKPFSDNALLIEVAALFDRGAALEDTATL